MVIGIILKCMSLQKKFFAFNFEAIERFIEPKVVNFVV